MSEDEYPTFKTKTGVCTVTPEYIVLTREGLRGQSAEALMGRGSLGKRLLLYALLGFALSAIGIYALTENRFGDAVIPLAGGLFLIVQAYRSRNNSATPVIPRADIRAITATSPKPPATRGYFTVQFDDNGRARDRLIILPGVLEGGSAEFDTAKQVLHDAGLTVVT